MGSIPRGKKDRERKTPKTRLPHTTIRSRAWPRHSAHRKNDTEQHECATLLELIVLLKVSHHDKEGIPGRAGSPTKRPRPKPQPKQDYKTGSQKGDPRRIPWGPTRILYCYFLPLESILRPSSSNSSHASGMAGPSSTRSTPLLSAPRLSARVRATSSSYFLEEPTTHSFLFLITVVGCLLRFVTCQSSFFVVTWVG